MKILKYIIFTIYLLSFKGIFSAYIPVESVFSDIKTDYKYYNELQELYNRQAIYPDMDGKFNPYSLLSRDEFVGITMEASCKKCTKPNTSLDISKIYKDVYPFYDVTDSNSFSYCIALANDQNYIDSYTKGYKCEDLTYNQDKIPFCPNNYITLEEALSIILRNSNLFSTSDNDKIIQNINDGITTNNLATDVSAKETDGTANEYYGYLNKALEYSIEEYDIMGVKKVYKLLELNDGKIYPQRLVTKEDFLKMAYIAFKTNSCKEVSPNNMALKIEINDSTCNSYTSKCTLARISPDIFKYDFKGFSSGACDLGIDETNGYIWKLYNKSTGDEVVKYGAYINDYTFLKDGIRQINLVVVDKCFNSGEVYSTLNLSKDLTSKGLDVSIDVNNITGLNPLPIGFTALIGGGNGDYTYVWDFGNNEKANGKNVDYIYNESGIYKTLLTVTDSDGNVGTATILLKVTVVGNCESQDSDNDGINDCDDLCQLVIGKAINNGCPIVTSCGDDCSCPSGKKCNITTVSLCPIKGVCIDDASTTTEETDNITNGCLEKSNYNKIYGNVICNTCPCVNFIDYISTIRKCDFVFPAITSTGSTDIFSIGQSYEVD